MTLDPQLVITVLGLVGTGGVAWGAAKAGATTNTRDMKTLTRRLEAHEKHDHEMQLENVERLARLETLVTEVHKQVVGK